MTGAVMLELWRVYILSTTQQKEKLLNVQLYE